MKKIILIILLFFFCRLSLYAQEEGFIWYFGTAGLSFHTNPPTVLTNSAMLPVGTSSGTISDKNGNLLFYNNGCNNVWNKKHKIMNNGTGLIGNSGVSESGLTVPLPQSNHIYYIFTLFPGFYNSSGLYYSIVDMKQDNGLGAVITKNTHIKLNPCSEKLTAARHANNKDIWIIIHGWNSDTFYSYLLTPNGLDTFPVISKCGSMHTTGGGIILKGCMKVSPSGKKLALANTGGSSQFHFSELFDFDNKTGIITNPIKLKFNNKNVVGGFGVEFSPDEKFLYIACSPPSSSQPDVIYQYNIISNDSTIINNSVYCIYSTFKNYSLQIAPDGRIYLANDYPPYVSRINSPNNKGSACNFIENEIYLNGKGCNQGFPVFLQSYFFLPEFIAEPHCLGDSTRFSLTDTGQVDSVHWNFGDPASGIKNSSGLFNPSHLYQDTGLYSVQAIIFHNYVADTNTRQIRIGFYPSASFSVSDNALCLKGNSFNFTNNSIIKAGSMSYEWDYGDSIQEYKTNVSHSYIKDSTYMVKLIALSDYGCTDTSYRKIIIYPKPKPNFTINDSAQCFAVNDFIFNNKTTNNNPGTIKFLWNFDDSQTDTITNPTHQYTTSDTFRVMLFAINQYGCKDSIIKKVTVNPQTNTSFTINDSSQCLVGNNFHYTNTTTGTNTYQWNFGDGQNDTNRITAHRYSTAGNYTIQLKTTSKEGCTDSISKTIIIFPQPKAGFTINDSIQCLKGNNFQLNNNTTGANKYFWDFGDSKTDTNNNSSHTYSSTGTFNIKLFVTSLDKCSDSIIKQINILPKPISGFGVNDSIQCLKSNKFHFNNSTTGANSYKWDFGDGNSDTILNPTHTYLINGIFNTNLISQSAGGCKDTSKLTITVLEVPTAAFSVNDTSQILPGNSFVFSNLTNCKPASSTCKYLWDFGDGQSDTISNPTHNYKAIGMYHVLLTATSTNGCKDTVSLNVYVTNIIVLIAFTVKDVCFGDLAYFKNSSTIQYDSFMNFLWDFGDGNTIIRPNPQHMYADTGTYKVQLVSLSYGGFRDTANGKVRVLSSPTVKIIATPDSILDQGLKATLSANGTFDSLLWSTGAITASIIVEKSGIYSIRVVDFNGCDAVDSITIEYLPEKPFSAMNVITPNDDGYNDVWKVSDIDQYRPCKVRIFNRWGDELYSSGDYQNNWAGTYKGKKLPEGTYYYVLETKDGVVYKGAINILKK